MSGQWSMKIFVASRSKIQIMPISSVAGWSSLVARQAHNLKVAGSNPAPAPNLNQPILKENYFSLFPSGALKLHIMSVTVKDLLDAGVHFGHQVRRWNPKSKPSCTTIVMEYPLLIWRKPTICSKRPPTQSKKSYLMASKFC